ncbi:MAG: hypothetical protein AAFV98_20680 [Chloroflexota bacterium]
MDYSKLKSIEDKIYQAFITLLETQLPYEKWLDSDEYRVLVLEINNLHKFYTRNLPKDGRLLLHHKVMQVIWSPTVSLMEEMATTEDSEKRKHLLETWQAIQGYVDVLIEDAQIGEDMAKS